MRMVGTNNSRSDPPEEIAEGIRCILDVIAEKPPQARPILLPIFPRGENVADKRRMCNEKVNEIIRDYADVNKVIWLDFNSRFLDGNGDTKWIMPDRLHPDSDGYRIWMEAAKSRPDCWRMVAL